MNETIRNISGIILVKDIPAIVAGDLPSALVQYSEYDSIFCEYNDFVRCKLVIMDRIGNVLKGVTERLVYDAAVRQKSLITNLL